jgi:1,4-dihydroxy-2-naphthoyl-CoA synthase
MSYETISVEKQGAVDWLTLNRPESLNAITTKMVTELRDYFGSLYENESVRIVARAERSVPVSISKRGVHARTRGTTFHSVVAWDFRVIWLKSTSACADARNPSCH